jgi:hypothetical protein
MMNNKNKYIIYFFNCGIYLVNGRFFWVKSFFSSVLLDRLFAEYGNACVFSERDSSGTTKQARSDCEGDGADSPTRARTKSARSGSPKLFCQVVQKYL